MSISKYLIIVGICAGSSILAKRPATAAPSLPEVRAEVAPGAVTFEQTTVGESRTSGVRITNHSDCDVTPEFARRGAGGPFGLRCGFPHSLGPGRSFGCNLTFRPKRGGQFSGRSVIRLRLSNRCRREAIVPFKTRHEAALERLDKQHELRLNALDLERENLEARAREALAKIKLERSELASDLAKVSPRADKKIRRLRSAAAARRKQIGDEITQARRTAVAFQRRGPPVQMLQQRMLVVRRQSHAKHAELVASQNHLCVVPDQLRQEMAAALDELRQGLYCSECHRPASQIMREERETLQEHTRRVNGRQVPASKEEIAAKRREYQQKIDRAVYACDQAGTALVIHTKSTQASLNRLEGEIRQVRREYKEAARQAEARLADLMTSAGHAAQRLVSAIRELKKTARAEASKIEQRIAVAEGSAKRLRAEKARHLRDIDKRKSQTVQRTGAHKAQLKRQWRQWLRKFRRSQDFSDFEVFYEGRGIDDE